MKNFQRLFIICFLLLGFIIEIIQAQTVDEIYDKFVKRNHTFKNTTLPYHIFTPDNYNPQIVYPLVLCLHGAGERGDDETAVKNNSMATVWARDSNQIRWPCFILVPQCPNEDWWLNSNIILTVNDILDSMMLEFSVDTNRLYVTGLSMGGYGTWDIITRFPNKFAAAVPVCGGGDTLQAALIKHVPIWNFHGALDNTVNVTYSRQMIAALENAGDTVVYTHCHLDDCTGLPENIIAEKIQNGAKLLYTEYEFGSHSVWNEAYNTIFLLPWTFAQSKAQASTGIEKEHFSVIPNSPCLLQNYPNPFNPTTKITFTIPSVGTSFMKSVKLKIYDLLGREIAILVDGIKSAGAHTIEWNAQNFPTGVYFCRLQAGQIQQQIGGQTGNYVETKKLILLK